MVLAARRRSDARGPRACAPIAKAAGPQPSSAAGDFESRQQPEAFLRLSKTDNVRGKQKRRQGETNGALADSLAFSHHRCAHRWSSNGLCAVARVVSMVRDEVRNRGNLTILLLYQPGAMHGDAVRGGRRSLRREPILSRAADKAAAWSVGEATPSPARTPERLKRTLSRGRNKKAG